MWNYAFFCYCCLWNPTQECTDTSSSLTLRSLLIIILFSAVLFSAIAFQALQIHINFKLTMALTSERYFYLMLMKCCLWYYILTPGNSRQKMAFLSHPLIFFSPILILKLFQNTKKEFEKSKPPNLLFQISSSASSPL